MKPVCTLVYISAKILRFSLIRFFIMRLLIGIAVCLPLWALGQNLGVLNTFSEGTIPPKLLSSKSVVLHSHELSDTEINLVHQWLSRTGIDAVVYISLRAAFAGADVTTAYATYFTNREVANLIVIQKTSEGFALQVTSLMETPLLITPGQSAWSMRDVRLEEALKTLYRTALAQGKKSNLLLSEVPERYLFVPVFTGNRNELFPYDLKIDALAVRKFGIEAWDKELEEIMKLYPFKYTLVEPHLSETDCRRQGMLYMLCFVHTSGPVAKQVLGYAVGSAQNALVSVTYPNGQEYIKTIGAHEPVYKFYARQIDYGHVYLGSKWDADTTWQQALRNFIQGFKTELRIN
jgi:hypothetical protein